jgi:hypothetical protein
MSTVECEPSQPWASRSAADLHSTLTHALKVMQSAEECAVLCFAEILRRKLYRELGYSSIHLYAGEALGFNPSRTSQFIRLAESLEKLPAVKAAMESGELQWTKARELARVATPASEEAWVAEAKRSSRRELERKVAEVKERAQQASRVDPAQRSLAELIPPEQPQRSTTEPIPADSAQRSLAELMPSSLEASNAASVPANSIPAPATVSFRMEAFQVARFDAIMEKLRRLGFKQSREELLLEALASLADEAENAASSRHASEAQADLPSSAAAEAVMAENMEGTHPIFPRGKIGEIPAGFSRSAASSAHDSHRGKSELACTAHGDNQQATPAGFPREKSSPFQIILYQCEQCGKAHVVTSRGQQPLSRCALEQAQCDAQVLTPGDRNRASIPPATRQAVLARDGHRCRVQGCTRSRFLEVHHVKPRNEGGSNKPENLVSLCSACHRLAHEHGLTHLRLAPVGSLQRTLHSGPPAAGVS